MTCAVCDFDPCQCVKPSTPITRIFRECETPGCTVMIGWAVGSLQGITTCKWCQAGTAYYADGSMKKSKTALDSLRGA